MLDFGDRNKFIPQFGEEKKSLKKLPDIEKNDSGDVALDKMLPCIPPELLPYLLREKDLPALFKRKEILNPFVIPQGVIRPIVLCRVSTAGQLQDVRSPLKQALAAVKLQETMKELQIVGCLLDFFKNGKAVEGRMFWDKLLGQLYQCKEENMTPVFNAIYVPEISRLSRRGSKIWEVVEVCRFYGLMLIDKSIRYNFADVKMVHALGSMAAEAENETVKLGQRLSESEAYRFDRYRTLAGNHFGFQVQNVKGSNNRVIASTWVPVEIEIHIIQFLYSEFLLHPNFTVLARMIKEKFLLSISPQQVKEILTTRKYLGIIYRKKRSMIVDIETELPIYREEQIPPEILENLSPTDKPPYKYFIPELVLVTLDQWLAVQEIIIRRQVSIKRNPQNPNRANRPAREHGKTAFSGLLTCGCCLAPLVLYGPSNTALFACQNRRKRRCGQNRSVREESIQAFLIPGMRKLLCEYLPIFLREYKIEFQNRIRSLVAEKNDAERLLQIKTADLKLLIKDSNALSTPQRLRLQVIIEQEMAQLSEIDTVIKSRENQINFLKSDTEIDQKKIMGWIDNLETLIAADPSAANEALRKIIDRIEIHVRSSVEENAVGLYGRIIFKVHGLARFFNNDLLLRDFIHPEASTDQFAYSCPFGTPLSFDPAWYSSNKATD